MTKAPLWSQLFTHGAHALDDPFAKWTDGSQDEEEDLDDTMPYRDHEVDHERVQIIEEHGTSVEELHDEEEQFSHSDTDNVPEHYEDDRRLVRGANCFICCFLRDRICVTHLEATTAIISHRTDPNCFFLCVYL